MVAAEPPTTAAAVVPAVIPVATTPVPAAIVDAFTLSFLIVMISSFLLAQFR
jgi:hypothetical protein